MDQARDLLAMFLDGNYLAGNDDSQLVWDALAFLNRAAGEPIYGDPVLEEEDRIAVEARYRAIVGETEEADDAPTP